MFVIPAGGALPRRRAVIGLVAFLAIVVPWSWTVTIDAAGGDEDADASERRPAIVRYLRALARLTLVLVREYFVVVLLVGATALIAAGVIACAISAGALLWLLGG